MLKENWFVFHSSVIIKYNWNILTSIYSSVLQSFKFATFVCSYSLVQFLCVFKVTLGGTCSFEIFLRRSAANNSNWLQTDTTAIRIL